MDDRGLFWCWQNQRQTFELCKPDGQPDAPIPAYLDYNHETLTMNCKNDNGEVYLSVDYYATGEVRAKKPMKNGSINGVVREYHPTGEILAEYNVVDDIPNGTIVYIQKLVAQRQSPRRW